MMLISHIRFNSLQDQTDGFYELATRAQVTSLPNGVYAVPTEALRLPDEKKISYRRASDAEVSKDPGSVRDTAAAVP